MALVGQAKQDNNFVNYRAKQQTQFWGKLIRTKVEETEVDMEATTVDEITVKNVDPEIMDCIRNPEVRFRGEGLSIKELWLLYIGVDKLTPEEEARGAAKKKVKEVSIEPIKTRRIIGREILNTKKKPTGTYDYYDTHFHDEGYLHFDQWLYARDQARKDLFWLNVAVLGNTKLTKATHQIVCDQFVQKNFDGVYREDYNLDEVQAAILRQNRVPTVWDEEKRNYFPKSVQELEDMDNYMRFMILLYPRAFFKSTIGRADAVQWLLACPDISMMIMTAARDLASTFVEQIKQEFYLAKGAQPKPLHMLFPEYVLRGVDGTSAEDLWCPARRRERTYPSLWADSIDSVLSGWHCDVLKFDDVVSNNNCATPVTREKLRDQIDNTLNLCDTWGKVDMLGTRYYPDDYYGTRVEKAKVDPDTAGLKYFVGAAWYVKPDFVHVAKKNLRELTEDMVTLTFPEHATFKYLRGILINNEQTFRCQQLNEPAWGDNFRVDFTEELLKGHLMSPMTAQRMVGETIISWDTAREAKKSSDYSTGVVMKIFQKPEDNQIAVVVVEVVYGKWTQSEIALQVATLNNRWRPRVNQVEDTGGLELLKNEVQNKSKQMFGIAIPNIYWHRVENEENAKRNRIKSLEILLKADRLYFAVGQWNEETFAQLIAYKGDKSTKFRKDDIPDAMSFISRYLPSSAPLSQKELLERAEREEQQYSTWLLNAQHQMYFGANHNAGIANSQRQEYEPEQSPSPYGNIAKSIFGGNGMRA
jgi:predicted phage terminase large subunit-like protein